MKILPDVPIIGEHKIHIRATQNGMTITLPHGQNSFALSGADIQRFIGQLVTCAMNSAYLHGKDKQDRGNGEK